LIGDCSEPVSFYGGTTSESLTCMLINVQSLVNKLHLLKDIVDNDCPSILALTETWAKCDNMSDQMLTMGNHYDVFRQDRLHRPGGGVCLLVSNYLNPINIVLPDSLMDTPN
jgi:hypothetical protein